MVLLRHRPWRRSIFSATFALFFFFFVFPTVLCKGLVVKSVEGGAQQQPQPRAEEEVVVVVLSQRGRVVVGPGSSPPTCRSRCGRCLPCRPVHVVIQPARTSPLDYYPEAWRCKCRNKIFMP